MTEEKRSRDMMPGYCITVSAGELIDRFLIEQVRTEMVGSGQLSDESRWSEANDLSRELDARVVEDLLRLHRRLWILEGAVRDITQIHVFVENARSIFAANDERHRLKAEIDATFPSSLSRPRTYGG